MKNRRLEEFTDEELILEFQQNDTLNAFEILVQRYKNPLMNFVFRFLGNYAATSDVVQETMIKVYKNKNSYKTIAKFSTWIYTIAGNLARTELKKIKRRNLFSINSFGEENKNFDIKDDAHGPDELTDSNLKEKIIQDALLKVNPIYREMVIMRDIQELTYEEISQITGKEIGTVKSRINRGRAQLRELLKDIYKD
ncbi:MAG: RNA polymerase subunit sigma-24 [Chlorobiaceae bacterium]|nr:RNA polymerase subunit sigma-24 [Chlorobiaceae bacterium]MBA4309856.1 RNA polymerase subunit sigma-24 [Chlorobiaceae bacterium]